MPIRLFLFKCCAKKYFVSKYVNMADEKKIRFWFNKFLKIQKKYLSLESIPNIQI